MKKFHCIEDRDDYLEVLEVGAALVRVSNDGGGINEVVLSRKDTLRLARHLIKLVEKMDD